jgi:predicted TIM-barrel fold metal-dependent hydrolase
MTIDVHVHLKSADPGKLDDELKNFVSACEINNTKACILGAGVELTGFRNDEVLKICQQYSDYFIPFAFVDLWDNIDGISICQLKEQGFKGLKCIRPYYAYDHDLYMPIYEAAEKLEMPIVFHTGVIFQNSHDQEHRRPMLRNMMPLTLDRIARSFPHLNIVMAHLGTTMFREQAAELIKFHPNLYADLAGTGSWLAMQPSELVTLAKLSTLEIDPDLRFFKKLVFGSDSYTYLPDMLGRAKKGYETLLERTGIPQEIVAGIMGGTIASWLKE